MRKLLVIAHREYAAMVATKAFLFTLIMMPILMFGGLFLMPKLSTLSGGKTQRIVVADGTGKLLDSLKTSADDRNKWIQASVEKKENNSADTKKLVNGSDERRGFEEQPDIYELIAAESPELNDAARLKLSDEIRSGTLYAFVEIPAAVLSEAEQTTPAKISFVSQDAMLSSARQWMAAVLQDRVNTIRLERLNLDPQLVAKANAPLAVDPTMPYTAKEDGSANAAKSGDTLVALFLPFGVMMLMFMVIFLAAQPMLESGMEEKSQRIAEVLLGSVTPTQMMAGKLIGNVCGSLMIFAIYGIGGWLIVDQNGWNANLPWNLIPWFIVFQLLGVLFFSSIFLTVGASISELKEAQSLLMPIWLVLMMPMMIWLVALRDPNGIVATTLSFFPPSAPLMMILRLASGQTIPAWQPPAAAILLLASTALVVFFAGRIYRASLLRTDSARTLKQIFGRLSNH